MSDNQSEAEEPSIEEILASIRQIISDDDEEEGTDNSPVADDEDVSDDSENTDKEADDSDDDDVLELTEELAPLEEDVEVDFVDVEDDVSEIEEPDVAEEISEEASIGDRFEPTPSSILSEQAQAATMASLSKLVGSMPLNRRGHDGITLEDVVRELLHPMLRDWMDHHLPPMVERIVQKELEKLARCALDE